MNETIAVFGSSVIEVKGYLEEELGNEKNYSGKVEISYGGSGKKIAENLGKIALSPVYISTTDSSNFGSEIKVQLEDSNVNTNYLLPVKAGGVGKSMSFVNKKGEIFYGVKENLEISHLETYIEKYGEKFSREFSNLILELELSEKISKKLISNFKKNKSKIFIYSIDLVDKPSDYSLFEEVECLMMSEKSAASLLECQLASMEIHQIQKTFKEFIKNNNAKRGIIVLYKRGIIFYDNVLNQSNFIECNDEEGLKMNNDEELLFSSIISGVLKGIELRDILVKEEIFK